MPRNYKLLKDLAGWNADYRKRAALHRVLPRCAWHAHRVTRRVFPCKYGFLKGLVVFSDELLCNYGFLKDLSAARCADPNKYRILSRNCGFLKNLVHFGRHATTYWRRERSWVRVMPRPCWMVTQRPAVRAGKEEEEPSGQRTARSALVSEPRPKWMRKSPWEM